MTAPEKYPQLKNKAFLIELLTQSVYSNMALEDQEVPLEEVRATVHALIERKELEGFQFLLN
jgi:hypothetical protein